MKPRFDCIYRLLVLFCVLATVPACSIDRDKTRGPTDEAIDAPLFFEVNYVHLHHSYVEFTPHACEISYVYIFQIDNNQKIDWLFPIPGSKDSLFSNPVECNKPHTIPFGEPFKPDKQGGEKNIYFMAFRQPNEELEKQYKDYLAARRQNNSILTKKLGEQFALYLNKLKPVTIITVSEKDQTIFKWSNKESVRVPVQRLNIDSKHVSVITFEYR